ncbi:MAG: lactonase family protein, partial [Actinobacteria bacterium]|nr:lactonase family protein [Actinomycetota bacterium]
LDQDARPGDPMVHPSAGATPFGFAVDRRGRILVSEAFGGAPDASALSSYEVDGDGGLSLLDASVPTTETAACWVVTTADGRFAYTTNTGSGTISGYSVDDDGGLELLDSDGVTASTGGGSGPIDLALSVDGRFLFDLRSGTGEIGVLRVRPDGSLEPIGSVGGLPAGSNGLAAR